MNVELFRASMADAEVIWQMQRIAFADLLAKYQDFDTNPGNEPLEKVQRRFTFPVTHFLLHPRGWLERRGDPHRRSSR